MADKDQDSKVAPEREDAPKAEPAPKLQRLQAEPPEAMSLDEFTLRVQAVYSRELLAVWRRQARSAGLVYVPETVFQASLDAFGSAPAE